MSEPDRDDERRVDRDQQRAGDVPEIDEGRYLYCLVRADEGADFETTGVDDETVSVISVDGIGAVVHACDGLYDTSDLLQVKRWLVRHQTVVDEAGNEFGTPIPFQFDTILRGGDEGLREWLREEYEPIDRTLSELAGHWEYRVEVVETDPLSEAELVDRDERLQDLDERIDESGEGTAYLLEKKYDERVRELRRARRESLTADLESRLDDVVREVHALDRSPRASLSEAMGGQTDGESEDASPSVGDEAADGETVCRLTVLAHENDEEAVGSILDEVAAVPGLEVRFTGPWPPYTFAPELGGAETDESGAGSDGFGNGDDGTAQR
nr:GvpL/GvpF family gas vesicle protein [Halosolutus gelatinilyticus]